MDSAELTTTIDMAMLELDPQSNALLNDAVDRMLEYFAVMSSVDVDGVSPTTHALITGNRTRPDAVTGNDTTEALIENAPDLEDRFITIPNVL